MDMDIVLNGSVDGTTIMAKSEMDQSIPDDRQLVEDGQANGGEGARETTSGQYSGQPAKNLGLGFGKTECSRPTGGLAILISGTVVFSVAVTVALIIQIYAGPHEVGQYGGVAADATQCSEIGVDILRQGGSAVDASIAALLCVSVIHAYNSGIGGGGFMLIHDHKTNTTQVFDFRETAPASATPDMFTDDPNAALRGPAAVGVPGFLRGLEKAHASHGKLPWRDLVLPSVEIARNGFNVTEDIVRSLNKHKVDVFTGPIRDIYVREGKFVELGDRITQPDLADTLSIIAEQGPGALYEGELAESIVNATNGHITLDDLQSYKVVERLPVESSFTNHTVLSMPAPGGGPTVLMILNILERFGWTPADKDDPIMYNRLLEAFRFAFAQRPLLADPDFESSVANYSNFMIMKQEAIKIAEKILSYNGTKAPDFYLPAAYLRGSHGTSHVSASDAKELYVSTTTSINYLFGAKLMTATGIQLNNHMADFDVPGSKNSLGLPPNELNFPEAKKRPLSAMSPTIVFTTRKPCALRMAIGAANATRIITGVAETILNMLSFKMTLEQAIDQPRVHDGLFEGETDYETGVPEEVVTYLSDQGYNLHEITEGISHVQAVMVSNDTTFAKSDDRKGGKAAVLHND